MRKFIRYILASLLLGVAILGASTLTAEANSNPSFVYPKNGQTLDYEGDYLFEVKPITGADLYHWSFLQNGITLADSANDPAPATNEYGIHIGTPVHAKFVTGAVKVLVSAHRSTTGWTGTTTITIYLKLRRPTPTTIPSNTATTIPSSTPTNTATLVPTNTLTNTPFPTSTTTDTQLPTNTPIDTATNTPTANYTTSPLPTITQSVTPTAPVTISTTLSTASANPVSVPADGISVSTLTVNVKNTLGQNVAGVDVRLNSTPSLGIVVSPSLAITDGLGNAQFTVSSTVAQTVTFTVEVINVNPNAIILAQQPQVTFYAPPTTVTTPTVSPTAFQPTATNTPSQTVTPTSTSSKTPTFVPPSTTPTKTSIPTTLCPPDQPNC